MQRLAGWLLIVALALVPATGRAQSADDTSPGAFAALGSNRFDQVREGIEQLTASGHPRAAAVIAALQAGHLYTDADHALFIKQDDGSFVTAETGAATDIMASGLKPVRVNNAVRNAIDAALGSLRLFASSPAVRLDAAEAVFKSHDPAALPSLAKALAKETDPAVKLRMEQARAAALLSSADAGEADRLAAVAVLRARGDNDSRSLLASSRSGPWRRACSTGCRSVRCCCSPPPASPSPSA